MGGTVQRKQERNDVQRKGKGVGVWCNSATLVERTFLYYSLCVVCTRRHREKGFMHQTYTYVSTYMSVSVKLTTTHCYC